MRGKRRSLEQRLQDHDEMIDEPVRGYIVSYEQLRQASGRRLEESVGKLVALSQRAQAESAKPETQEEEGHD